MKYKILLLIIISSLITYLLYNKYYQEHIDILSINTSDKFNYNNTLAEYLDNKYNFNIDYSNSSLEIENLTNLIKEDNKIKNAIHKSEYIILYIGNIDMLTENNKQILKEYNTLFKKLRSYNNKKIIFLSPINFKDIYYLKELCHKYNIVFINTSSYLNIYNEKDITNNSIINISKIIEKRIM